jgi:hypothetical protein
MLENDIKINTLNKSADKGKIPGKGGPGSSIDISRCGNIYLVFEYIEVR